MIKKKITTSPLRVSVSTTSGKQGAMRTITQDTGVEAISRL